MTKHLLLPLFKNIDMVEQDRAFVDKAPTFLVNYYGIVAVRAYVYALVLP